MCCVYRGGLILILCSLSQVHVQGKIHMLLCICAYNFGQANVARRSNGIGNIRHLEDQAHHPRLLRSSRVLLYRSHACIYRIIRIVR